MNSHQRRKFMAEKHMRMPLGSKVTVRSDSGKEYPARIFKHDRGHKAIVDFENGSNGWVPISRIRPVERLNVRPWWRDMRNKHARRQPSK